jgi:hypothetical protein
MDWCHYRFRSAWRLDAPPTAVYAALARVERYPDWWPQVRYARPVDGDTIDLLIRSVLPVEIRMRAHSSRRDPAAGILEARISGDLAGFSRWTVTPRGGGTRAVFEEIVDAGAHPVLRRWAFARPAFHANHALMMWHGRLGLRTHLRDLTMPRA